jgi:hypothetical protein
MNIVRVHGAWADASSWSRVIPFLLRARHRVVAVQLRLTPTRHAPPLSRPVEIAETRVAGGSAVPV